MSPVGFCAVARAQGRAPDRLGSTGVTNASEERRAEHRGAPLAGCAETRRATVARYQQPCPTGVHEHASLPAPADHSNAPCTSEMWHRHDGIRRDVPDGKGFRLVDCPRSDVSVMQRNIPRPGRCRTSDNFTALMRTRQATLAGDSSCRRRQEARPAWAQRSARAQHPAPGTRHPARRATRELPSLSPVIFRVPPIHAKDHPWLSNSTDCRRKNCRP